METRPESTASSSAGASASLLLPTPPIVEAVPDDVLLTCFSSLSLLERHRALPLVCRRWNALLLRPQLLSTVAVDIEPAPPPGDKAAQQAVERRQRSLLGWLSKRGAGNVQRLVLQLLPCGDDVWWLPLLAHALEACGAAGGLQELEVSAASASVSPQDIPPTAVIGSWAAALNQLCSLNLDLGRGAVLVLGANLAGCRVLQDLKLAGYDVHISPEANLPVALTSLEIQAMAGLVTPPPQRMPGQLAACTRLERLALRRVSYKGDATLVALCSTLRYLRVDDCGLWLPSCLSRLTGLRSLRVSDKFYNDFEEDDVEDGDRLNKLLAEAFPHLQQLRNLRLEALKGLDVVPASVGALPQLRCFCWQEGEFASEPLPGGAWLERLRQLGSPAHVVAGTLGLLDASEELQLEVLQLGCADWYPEEAESIIRWAVERRPPRLRRIILHSYTEGFELPAGIQVPPALQLEVLHNDSVSWEEACDRLDGSS